MPEIKEMLPFLIPLVIVEFTLLIYTFHHILTHTAYKRGSSLVDRRCFSGNAVYRSDSLFPVGKGGELIWRC